MSLLSLHVSLTTPDNHGVQSLDKKLQRYLAAGYTGAIDLSRIEVVDRRAWNVLMF